jgi:hypothetical protein
MRHAPVAESPAVSSTPGLPVHCGNRPDAVSGPNFNTRVDGWILSSAGYQLSDFLLRRKTDDGGNEHCGLRLGIKRMPKPMPR